MTTKQNLEKRFELKIDACVGFLGNDPKSEVIQINMPRLKQFLFDSIVEVVDEIIGLLPEEGTIKEYKTISDLNKKLQAIKKEMGRG